MLHVYAAGFTGQPPKDHDSEAILAFLDDEKGRH
jgi:hypothetical protein